MIAGGERTRAKNAPRTSITISGWVDDSFAATWLLLLHRALLAVVASGLASLERSRGDEMVPRLERDVMPILKARCLKCHSPLVSKGKLNLSSARSLARGGKNGPVIVPGKLDESTLWEQISENEMPPEPEEPLSADEKGLLRRWIEQGAPRAYRRCRRESLEPHLRSPTIGLLHHG